MPTDLSGQVILVTGAGRGIGAATAQLLAQRGAAVGVLDIAADLAEATAKGIAASGGKAMALVADASSRSAVLEAAARLHAAFGALTAVVNDAIWIRYEPIQDIQEETLDRMLAIGVKGVFWGVQALLAHRDGKPAAIVNLASPVADLGTSNTASYTSVKGAVVALTRQMAVELGPQGVRVNAVAPGAVPTPGARMVVDEAGYAKRRAQTPLGRLGAEAEIAAAIAFLLCDDASFITGEVLHADGGISIKSM